ncbi:MAG: DUF2757 family protein [Firmicutes bacterium]|nr:DUF2757 family protein [Bacillota bacterium]
MNIVYYCKHCKSSLGALHDAQASPEALGFTSLSSDERADLIEYVASENTAYVKTVCEYCESALSEHPDLLLSQTPIQ